MNAARIDALGQRWGFMKRLHCLQERTTRLVLEMSDKSIQTAIGNATRNNGLRSVQCEFAPRVCRACRCGYFCGVPRRCERALLELVPDAVGLDQHILRISKLLLPLDAQPAKVRPASLFALREPLDQFEVDLGAVLLRDHAESLPRLGSRWAKLLDNLPDVSHLLDASGCLSGKTYGIKIDAN